MKYKYYLIDAFTSQPFQGAPVAVFSDAAGLADTQMQIIAKELNQAETVFIFHSSEHAINEIRVFTPENELDFGGHPIIAASYALLHDKKISVGSNKLKIAIGMVDIYVSEGEKIQFSINAETKKDDFVPSTKELAEILYLDEADIVVTQYRTMISGCGENFLIVPVKSIAQLNKARFNEEKWVMSFVATLAKQILLFCENKTAENIDFNARLLGKNIMPAEDPPIGSSIPAFGNYIFSNMTDGVHTTTLQRGGEERRISTLEVEVHKQQGIIENIKVGGYAVMVGEGCIYLENS